jgi:2-keto-3-deoxy-6-phosphogluconate aldolase
MCKFRILCRIRQARIVAVIRFNSADTAFTTSEASIEGGMSALEISCATPDALESIKRLVSVTPIVH